MRHLTWKNVFLTLLGASLVLIAGFYATGIDGFVVASAITLIFLLLAAWVWAIQSLIVRGYRWLVAGYIVVLLCAALVSVSGFYVTGIGDLAITGAIAITLSFTGVVLLLARQADRMVPGSGTWCVAAAVGLYMVVVANNLLQIGAC